MDTQLSQNQLIESFLENGEGELSAQGALCVKTGKYTARHASAKYIVDQPGLDVCWDKHHKKLSPLLFQQYWLSAEQHLKRRSYTGIYQVGNHAQHHLTVNVQTELAWHQLFAKHLFIESSNPRGEWEMRCCPSLSPSMCHPAIIVINVEKKQVLICGTAYAGEIKKAMFTVMNYMMPDQKVLPMHCAAILNSAEETTLMLGLSGTGKTSLSSGFTMIGDDEHGWADDGVFNFEGGCYAKCEKLSATSEGQIFQAIKEGTILENVILTSSHQPDFQDSSITSNTRAAYPLENIPNHSQKIAPQPRNIIYLCCDLYGVIPAVSQLTPEQAINYYLLGYTALVGNTETNSAQALSPTSSPCFGKPFFPKPLPVYASLLKHRLHNSGAKVWLVNTGWHNGDIHTGRRYPIETSRQIIHSIINNHIDYSSSMILPDLELQYYTKLNLPKAPALTIDAKWQESIRFKHHIKQIITLMNQQREHDYA